MRRRGIDGRRSWEEIEEEKDTCFQRFGWRTTFPYTWTSPSIIPFLQKPDVCSYPGVTVLSMRISDCSRSCSQSQSQCQKLLLSGSPLIPLLNSSCPLFDSKWFSSFPLKTIPLFLLLFCIGIIGLQFARKPVVWKGRRAKKMGFHCCSNNIRLISSRSFVVRSHTQRDQLHKNHKTTLAPMMFSS